MAREDFGVVIGISRYPLLGKDLEGPVKDAQDFHDWLTHLGQVPLANTVLVTSQDPPAPGDRPILEDINAAFRNIFGKARRVSARRLYVYFAGHGCAHAIRHVALLMANASLDELDQSINTLSYHDRLAEGRLFPQQVFFYDCCRNYDQKVRGQDPPWTHEAPEPSVADVNQFVLYGAGFTKYAYERHLGPDYSTRRGLFTRALIDGLKGGAARKKFGDWVVTTSSLLAYTQRRLQYLAHSQGVDQRLNSTKTGAPEDMILWEVDEPVEGVVTVTSRVPGVKVVVKDENLRKCMGRSMRRNSNKLEIRLPYGLYQIEIEPGGDKRQVEVCYGVPVSVAF